MKRPGTVALAAVLSIASIATSASAQGSANGGSLPPPEKPVRLFAKVEFASAYYYRGFVQETDGLIVQPAFRGELDLFRGEPDHFLRRVSGVLAMRSSFHSEQTGATGNGPEVWYESDLIAGLRLDVSDRWSLDVLYVAVTSPNGAWDTIQEIDLDLSYNDAGLWGGDFAIRPRAKLVIEVDGSAAAGEEGTHLELAAEPGFGLIRSGDFPVRLSFPVSAGLSLDEYYVLPFGGEDETFGYLKAGVSFTAPLMFIPPDRGQWALTVGADMIHLGDNLELLNRGDGTDLIGRIGIGARF